MIALLLIGLAVALTSFGDDDRAGSESTGAPGAATTAPARPGGGGDAGDDPAGPGENAPPADEMLGGLPVQSENAAGYRRERFGEGWATGRTGCEVRDEVLAAESTVAVTRGSDGCTVVRGNWVSLYDGYQTPNPDELEVDHVVPLAEAWASGAASWPADKRVAYANDVRRADALIAVTAATNQAKGDDDPAEWMPSDRESWCRYATAWIVQKETWGLSVDRAEREALSNVLATCDS